MTPFSNSKCFVALYLLGSLVCIVKATFPFPDLHAVLAPEPNSLNATPEADSPNNATPEADSPNASPASAGRVFDVTKYRAVADGKTENHLAFLAAWDAACKCGGDSTLLIPKGTFFVGPISFNGPCYNKKSPKIEIRGTLKAPTNLDAFPTPTWITFRGLCGMDLTGAGTGLLDGQGESTWTHGGCQNTHCKNYPCTVRFIKVSNATINDITLLNSKGFHASISNSENIHIHDIKITAPGDSPNTDGIHISDSTNINITSAAIGVGDDCISIGPGTTNIAISKVHCGPGHGISVGSLGKYPNEKDVVGLDVKNCTMVGTDNGVRVKTWPGSPASKATNLTFENIVMIDVKNPIIIDQEYCPWSQCTSKPSLVQISDIYFKNIRGTSISKSSVTLVCSSGVPCENIQLVDIDLTYTGNGDAIATCLHSNGIASGKQIPSPCL